MHKSDRFGALVIAFAIFALYIGIVNWLALLDVASLPLAAIDPLPLLVFDLAILSLYLIRQKKRSVSS